MWIWIYLVIAGFLEVVWAVGLKYTEGFTKLLPSVGTVFAMVLSFVFLSKSVKEIPIGTAYVVWTGIGAIGVTIAGVLLFKESYDFVRILCIFLVVAGIIGLRFTMG
jgi:quaternary ammonium compound-resistance protein SugE